MLRSRAKRRPFVPSISTQKSQTKDYEFVKGWNSNLSNDDVPQDQLVYITDAREVQVGKWETRKGNDFFSVPIGEAVNVEQTSTSGAGNATVSYTSWIAKKIVATTSGAVTAIEANLRYVTSATGTIVLALYTDSSGAPGTELFRTTIAASAVTGTYQYLKGRSISCPDIVNGTTYWVVIFTQAGSTGTYQVSSTTNATTGLSSSNSGATWSASNVDYNVKLSTATSGPVKGLIRLRRPNGSKYTFFAHGTSLYSVNEGTGATTAVDTGLDASATYCRFAFVNDILYYVTGLQKPRKYDFSTASEVTTAPENASNIIEHKGIVFYTSAVDPAKEFWTNFAAYETFTSTDTLYVPAPKTADDITAKFRLNGILYIVTRNNKYMLYGSQSATFRLENAIGQKGTYSQESVAWDEDYAYLANDDGIFRFNGAEEVNIAEDILNRWTELLDKDNTVLELYNNRLYVWYTPNGSAVNSKCFVYNVLYQVWESDDTLSYVQRSYSRDVDNYFLQGSNRVGMIMLSEQSTNDYNTMGEPFTYDLRTSYYHYDSPAQFKRAPYYRPHFDTAPSNYSISVGYATDYGEDVTYTDVELGGTGPRFDTGLTFDSGVLFGGADQVNPMDSGPVIAGEWRRLQLRYRKYAAREPVSFDGHVLALETQRLI